MDVPVLRSGLSYAPPVPTDHSATEPSVCPIVRTGVVVFALAVTAACSASSPASPTGSSTSSPASPTGTSTSSLVGSWSGTTFQGRAIAFTVSADQLTSLTVGYAIDTCSGVATFSNLAVPLFTVGGTNAAGFVYGATLADRPQVGLSVQGYLMPDGSVWGTLIVYGLPSCGPSESVAGSLQATRR